MIFCVGVEPHIASYSCLQNNCNMMNNKLNCETIFATLYFLHPSKCLQALLMVPYLDSHEELGIHFYCSEFNTSIYNSRHARYGKCFFVSPVLQQALWVPFRPSAHLLFFVWIREIGSLFSLYLGGDIFATQEDHLSTYIWEKICLGFIP